jgi:hypothetical protein
VLAVFGHEYLAFWGRSELLWKPLRSDFPGTKHCARNTSTEKSSERGSIPAGTSSRQKRYVIGTTNRSGHSLGLSALLNKLPNRLGRYRSGLPSHFAPGSKQSVPQAIGFRRGTCRNGRSVRAVRRSADYADRIADRPATNRGHRVQWWSWLKKI